MDYPVLTAANGESVIVSGHPAENKTFDFYMPPIGRTDLADDPRFADVATRLANLDALDEIIRDVRTHDARRRVDRGAFSKHNARRRAECATVATCATPTGPDEREVVVEVTDRGRRHDPHPQRAVAVQRQPRRRRARARLATAARTTGRAADCSASTTPRSTRSRRTGVLIEPHAETEGLRLRWRCASPSCR